MAIKFNVISLTGYAFFIKKIRCFVLLPYLMLCPLYTEGQTNDLKSCTVPPLGDSSVREKGKVPSTLHDFKSISEDLSLILKQIPEKDLEDIRDLFSNFIYKNHFAYTLFGEKAVSLSCCIVSKPHEFKIPKKLKSNPSQIGDNTLGVKWEKWKCYQSLFSIKKYLIIEEMSWFSPYIKHILLINKEQFVKVFNENQAIFHRKLGSGVTGESLLAEVEKQGQLGSVIKHNELLFGILLGYGKHNAALYDKREHLQLLYDQYKYVLVKNSPTIKDLDKQADGITDVLQPCGDYCYNLSTIPSTYFVADPQSEETLVLKKKYQALREKVSIIYAQDNVLEITLSTLIQD